MPIRYFAAILLGGFLLGGTLQTAPAQQAEVVDGVAAIVNSDVVTISQVRELVGARERAMREGYTGPDLADKIKEMRLGALKDLVDRQLIIQEFRSMQEKGANIPDYVIDDRVQTIIREEFGGDRAAFIRTLQAQGFTLTRFKEIEREKIIVQADFPQLPHTFVSGFSDGVVAGLVPALRHSVSIERSALSNTLVPLGAVASLRNTLFSADIQRNGLIKSGLLREN